MRLRKLTVLGILACVLLPAGWQGFAAESAQIDERVRRWWMDLAKDEQAAAKASEQLVTMGPRGAAELGACIRAMNQLDADRIGELIRQLDADEFRRREDASAQLRDVGTVAEPMLRRARETTRSAEVRHRIDVLLDWYRSRPLSPADKARYERLASVLAQIGGREALGTSLFVVNVAPTEEVRKRFQNVAGVLGRNLVQQHLDEADDRSAAGPEAAIKAVQRAMDVARMVSDIPARPIEIRLELLQQRQRVAKQIAELEQAMTSGKLSADGRLRLALLYVAEADAWDRARSRFGNDADERVGDVVLLVSSKPASMGGARLASLGELALELSERDDLSSFGQARLIGLARDHLVLAAEQVEGEQKAGWMRTARGLDVRLLNMEPLASVAGAPSRLRTLPAEAITQNLQAFPRDKLAPLSNHDPYVYPVNWYVVGPLPQPDKVDPKDRGEALPDPTQPADIDRNFISTEGKPVGWSLQTYKEPTLVGDRVDRNCSYYGYTEFYWDRSEGVTMTFGCDDQAEVWVNGASVWKSERGNRSWTPDLGTKTVSLNAGLNRVMFQLDNSGGAMSISVAIAKPQRSE